MARFPGVLLVTVTVALLSMLVATSASAQPASAGKSSSAKDSSMKVEGSGASYKVEFTDDPLNALNDGVLIPRIVVRPGAVRVMLLRPRASFVTEMLKSVEML
jgi:hypothetical protein